MAGILYSDRDPNACAWLRELVAAGELPDGEVWCRDIATVTPDEVARFHQRHWFCGIGGWPLALALAEWPDDAPVDTASVPCQPFSVAGNRKGANDVRHLWPTFFRLVRSLRPPVIFGEQVAGADVVGKAIRTIEGQSAPAWLDGVFGDLESEGYATGAAVLGAFAVGAPHRRQRLYWVAHTHGGLAGHRELSRGGEHGQRTAHGRTGVMEHAAGARCERKKQPKKGPQRHETPMPVSGARRGEDDPGWDRCRYLPCRDGRTRRTESQPQPLADGVPALLDALRQAGLHEDEVEATLDPFPIVRKSLGRLMLLRGYGNAIVPILAAQFARAFLEVTAEEFGGGGS